MRYLVDSDWTADYLVGKQDAVALLDRLISKGIGVSLITLGEIDEGIYYGRDPDLFIAATALPHGLMLVTRNQRHFKRIADLKLYESATLDFE